MRTLRGLIAVAAIAAAPVVNEAARTREWAETAPRLKEGESSGVAVTTQGGLFLAPELTRLGGDDGSGRESYVWSVVSDARGNVYLGTGPDGRILRVTQSGAERLHYTVAEPMVTALAVLPDGHLLAGTAPEGRIYRIREDGTGGVWAETGERYVWSLVVARDGTLYAGTGERGRILEIDESGETRTFFDSDEPHIVALATRDDGRLLAGGAGRGLLYELDAEGHAFVLHDDDLPEVRAIAVEPDGALVAAVLGPPEIDPRPPAVRIQLPDGVGVSPAAESVGELEERPGPTIRGTIEGLETTVEKEPRRSRGRLIRITPDGGVGEIWQSTTEAPFCLALDSRGRAVFGTGEPGRLYRVGEDDEVALLASLIEAQVTGLVRAGPLVVAGTSNPAGAYRFERDVPEAGVFVSPPYDAGAPAKWGTIRWRVRGPEGRIEIDTRTGNSADPDATWSGWGRALGDPSGSVIRNPDGRFLQWRVRLIGAASRDVTVSDVTVSYVPLNRPPALADFRLRGTGRAVADEALFRWNTRDPDGDPLEVRVEYRTPGETGWTTAFREAAGDPDEAGTEGSRLWRAGEASWETTEVAEGRYEVRAVVSDVAANHPGEGREVGADRTLMIVIDRAAPEVTARRLSDGAVEIEVVDALSPVDRLEVVQAGRVVFLARPVDGIVDSSRETFRLDPAEPGADAGSVSVRAVDRAGNAAETPLP